MAEFAKEIYPVNLEDEMRQSYLDYAMSVIVGRALPDCTGWLKPVHRRVLYAMSELGNDWNKPLQKSGRVVGDVFGNFTPLVIPGVRTIVLWTPISSVNAVMPGTWAGMRPRASFPSP